MKKILTLLLAMAVMISLTGCGGSSDGDSKKTLSDTVTLSSYNEETNTYTNDYTGLECTISGNWTYEERDPDSNSGYTMAEIAAMSTEELSQVESFTDLYLMEVETGNGAFVEIKKVESAEEKIQKWKDEFDETPSEESVMLSGVEYQMVSGHYNGTMCYFYYLVKDDGHIVCIYHISLDGDTSPKYFQALFNGGLDTSVKEENIPDISTLDTDLWRYTNRDTGLEIDIPTGWTYTEHDVVANVMSGINREQLDTMTKADYGKLDEIYDLFIGNPATKDNIMVSYMNRKNHQLYGLSMEEILQHYDKVNNTDDSMYMVYDTQTVNGVEYHSTMSKEVDRDDKYYYLLKELNEDYIIKIQMYTKAETSFENFWNVLNSNNDNETLIKRSVASGSYRYVNEATGVKVNTLKDWVRLDEKMLDVLYSGDLTVEQLEQWTDDDYHNAVIVPDFAVGTADRDTTLMVYYVNLNKADNGRPITFDEYYSQAADLLEDSGFEVIERDAGYEINNNTLWIINATHSGGERKMRFGMAPINDDYILMMRFSAPADSSFEPLSFLSKESWQ